MTWGIAALTALLAGGVAYLLTPWMGAVARVHSALRQAQETWLRSWLHVGLAVLLGFGSAVLAHGWMELIAFAALGLACSLLIVIDLAAHRLPDVIVGPTYVLLFLAFTVSAGWSGDWHALGRAALAAAAVGLCYFLLALISPAGLGLGDVKLAGLLGAFLGWLGWSQVLIGTAAAFVINGLVVALLLLARRISLRSTVAFGPWIVAGAVLAAASQAIWT